MVFPNKIDSLGYQYEPYSNKLLKVIDATASPLGFKDNPEDTLEHSPAPDYDYDSAGNLIHDANKRITSISYNHLNLPVEIVFYTNRKMHYIYTATGKKILKDAPAGGDQPAQGRTVTDYLWGFQYQNEVLKFFPTTEGYVSHVIADSTDVYRYVYNYLDHLGNVRVSYGRDESDKIRILEENHYYPYGLKHTNYNPDLKKYDKKEDTEEVVLKAIPVTDESKYDYKFNGQEWQDEEGLNLYDMDMRDYDPAIGRWLGVDPVTHFDQSTYMAMDGNPVSIADPSGADGVGPEPVNTWHYAGIGSMNSFLNGGAGNLGNGDHMLGGTGDDFWMGNGAVTSIDAGSKSSPIVLSGNTFIVNWNSLPENNSATWVKKYLVFKSLSGEVSGNNATGVNGIQGNFKIRGGNANVFFGVPIRISPYKSGGAYFGGAINVSDKMWKGYLHHGLNSYEGRFLMHEYGHYLQETMGGSLWYNMYVTPSSIISAWFNNIENHAKNWTEIQASTYAYYYFGFPTGFTADNNPIDINSISDFAKGQIYNQYLLNR